ncbi:MAG: helix-turn-helix domain-containing protein [Clostridia bacterium]|nr:helix-turn-helix domain-containing protein [Clostridia bacterium]
MIKPKIKKGINPQTGETIEIVQWPNIYIYGLTDKEKEILNKSLPSKNITVTDVTGDANQIVTQADFAVIINPDNISDKELEFFINFYEGFEGCTESIIFTKSKGGLKELFKFVKVVEFNDSGELEHNLKYELLQALQKTNKSDNFSNSLSQAIIILFAIRNNPYITTKTLAEKIERTPRTVQRYIETLRCAGEWIAYDKNKKGWYLYDGKSILLDEI